MKRSKRMVAALLSALMLLSVFACFSVSADTYYVFDNFKFKYLDDDSAMISEYYGTDTTMVIPDTLLNHPVSSVEPSAFYGDSLIEHIEFGANFKAISAMSFAKSTALNDITLPKSLEVLAWGAFQDCTALSSVVFEDSKVTTIPSTCFSGCTALRNVVLGNSITTIGNKAFADCAVLDRILIPASVTSISSNAFSGVTNATIYCYSNSYAHHFAVDNNMNFSLLDAVDKSGLEASLISAEEILDNPDNYYPDTLTELEQMYDAAVLVYENSFATQNQIIYAKANLDAAINSVKEYIVGDVDLDGKITIMDATEIQKYLAKLTIFTDLQIILADLTGDNDVNILDATYIQMYLAKLL